MSRHTNGRAARVRARMLPLQHGLCWWDGDIIEGRCGEAGRATVDHLVHVSHGGTNSVDNIVIACRACNSARGTSIDWMPHPRLFSTPRYEILKFGTLMDLQVAMKDLRCGNPQHNSHVRAWKRWMSEGCPDRLPDWLLVRELKVLEYNRQIYSDRIRENERV